MNGPPEKSGPPASFTAGKPSFQILFQPSVTLISLVRRFVSDFYQKVVDDVNLASRLALTTHELLENSAKYSSDGAATLYVEVDPRSGKVLVRTTNGAAPDRVEALQKWFAEMHAANDVEALYADMVRRTAMLRSGSGGLGLARILAEGEMEMHLRVDGDLVEITASGMIGDAG